MYTHLDVYNAVWGPGKTHRIQNQGKSIPDVFIITCSLSHDAPTTVRDSFSRLVYVAPIRHRVAHLVNDTEDLAHTAVT